MGPKSALLLAALKTKETSIIIHLISKNIEGKQKLSKASNFGVSSLTGDRPGICHALRILVSFNLALLDESSLFTQYHGYDGDDHDGDVDVHPGEHGMHAGLPASQSNAALTSVAWTSFQQLIHGLLSRNPVAPRGVPRPLPRGAGF